MTQPDEPVRTVKEAKEASETLEAKRLRKIVRTNPPLQGYVFLLNAADRIDTLEQAAREAGEAIEAALHDASPVGDDDTGVALVTDAKLKVLGTALTKLKQLGVMKDD